MGDKRYIGIMPSLLARDSCLHVEIYIFFDCNPKITIWGRNDNKAFTLNDGAYLLEVLHNAYSGNDRLCFSLVLQ